jgi:hypothetical protein
MRGPEAAWPLIALIDDAKIYTFTGAILNFLL